MFANKRSGTDPGPVDSSATYIGTDVQLEGTIRGKGVLRIEGRVTGQIEHEGTVVIGPRAEVHAKLTVRELVVQGFVEGSIQAERCEIGETARVNGEIRAQKLSVAEGASLTGDLATNPQGKGKQAAANHGSQALAE
ncbi:MAG: polymer-forming cytoskeletal protein [Thermaerobacter sp.]|nr:polymer-forming cytoskeletal protein [Thermaerobacter sp.]